MATAVVAVPVEPAERRVVLHDVSWQTYECLLADHIDRSAPRFTYDRGELEIVSPGIEHERDSGTLALLVEIVAAAWSIPVLSVGSMTYKRHDLQRGFEPDASFYVRHEASVRDKDQIDSASDPPPDLVIEVDVTSPSLDKFPIFAEMGVPEVWRRFEGRITIHVLVSGSYREAERSAALPYLTAEIVTRFLDESRSLPRPMWFQAVSDWARSQKPPSTSDR